MTAHYRIINQVSIVTDTQNKMLSDIFWKKQKTQKLQFRAALSAS